MTFLPIVERELRERARWRSTYWVRGVAAFAATAIAMFVLMFMAHTTGGGVGKGVMLVLAWLAFPFVLFEGLRNTADSLSFEKREGTLGLLFLTDLRGYDVVLGKFIASSLTSIYALLAMVPALAIPVLLGGVTGSEFWRLVLALFNALFFSLTTGMFVSSISRSERRAWSGTLALLVLFVGVIPAVSKTLHFPIIWMFSPFTAFWLFDEASYLAGPERFWNSIWVPLLLSGTWLFLASVLLPRSWQEKGRGRAVRARTPESQGSRQSRNRMLDTNPVWWLTSRNTHQRRWLWLIVGILSVSIPAAWFAFRNDATALWSILGLAVLAHLGFAVWVASEATDSFSEARATGAIELLLSTPLNVRQILRGQHQSLRELFFAPLAVLITVEACVATAQIFTVTQAGGGAFERVATILVLGFCLVWFVLDLFAVAEVGMWFGLTSAKSTQALTKTILYVIALPLILLGFCWFVGPGLLVAKSVIFFTWAQNKLETEFRKAAAARFDSPASKSFFRRTPPRLRMPGDPG